jgi:hypothetical protein
MTQLLARRFTFLQENLKDLEESLEFMRKTLLT